MKKLLNFIIFFVLFTSNIFAADENEKGIADNGIWGTRCNYSDGSYREIKSSDPGGPPPRC